MVRGHGRECPQCGEIGDTGVAQVSHLRGASHGFGSSGFPLEEE